jgi:hypothetical protein
MAPVTLAVNLPLMTTDATLPRRRPCRNRPFLTPAAAMMSAG